MSTFYNSWISGPLNLSRVNDACDNFRGDFSLIWLLRDSAFAKLFGESEFKAHAPFLHSTITAFFSRVSGIVILSTSAVVLFITKIGSSGK